MENEKIVWTPSEIVKRSFYLLVTIILFPAYFVSYTISKTAKFKGHEDMESLGEWLTMWCNPDYE